MKKVLAACDRVVAFILENVAAVMTAAIFAIVVMVVILRFVFKSSSGGFEELPTYFLMIAIWFGAAICARNPKEGLIRIDLFETLLKNAPTARALMNMAASAISIFCIAIYAHLSFEYVIFCFDSNQTTLALAFPMWVLTGLTFVACFFLLVYEVVGLVRNAALMRGIVSERRASQ